jgi:GYF domain 2
MGIRFQCPNGHKLNVKADLAGKRASCPECGAKLVIPAASAEPVAARAAIVVNPASENAGVWYLRTADGEQLGPATEPQLSDWIAAGRVTADALIWRDGWPEWKLAGEVADRLPAPLVAPPEPPAVANAADIEPSPAEPAVVDPVEGDRPLADSLTPAVAINGEPAAASSYVEQRRRGKRTQLVLAVVMLLTVLVLAGLLVWVVHNNSSVTPQTSRADRVRYSGASATFG